MPGSAAAVEASQIMRVKVYRTCETSGWVGGGGVYRIAACPAACILPANLSLKEAGITSFVKPSGRSKVNARPEAAQPGIRPESFMKVLPRPQVRVSGRAFSGLDLCDVVFNHASGSRPCGCPS